MEAPFNPNMAPHSACWLMMTDLNYGISNTHELIGTAESHRKEGFPPTRAVVASSVQYMPSAPGHGIHTTVCCIQAKSSMLELLQHLYLRKMSTSHFASAVANL